MKYFKNTIILKFILLLMTSCLLQSCSDFLEQEPGEKTSITEQLKDKKGVLMALSGLYLSLKNNVSSEMFSVYADVQGGNLKFTPSYSGSSKGQITIPENIKQIYSFEDQSADSDFRYFYSSGYNIINQANLILEYTDAIPDATDAEKSQIKAEALTIRAYMHFLLSEVYSQNYGYTPDASHMGIVYSTQSIDKGITYPARETAAGTYTLIINDLKTSLDLYSNAKIFDGPSYSYFTSNSTKALLARVYLSKKDWKNAYDTANDVIANSGISLVSSENYIAQWEQIDLPTSETLLEFSVTKSADGTVSGSLSSFFGYTFDTNYANYTASADLVNLYESNDIRKQLFLEKPLSTLVNLQPQLLNYYFTKKFQGNPGYVAFRLSEQYLIRAEAALGLDRPEDAKTDINIIRARANADLLTTTDNIAEVLFLERRKELCFEGHLLFDIARNKKDISRTDGCISLNCGLTYPSPKYVLPIPLNTLYINSNLKQNESY